MIYTVECTLKTTGHCDVHDVTPRVVEELGKTGLRQGHVLVFVTGSTAGVTTVEFEPGLVRDLQEFFEKILPEDRDYHHHATWGDDNGSSHMRAALLKPSLTIEFPLSTALTERFCEALDRLPLCASTTNPETTKPRQSLQIIGALFIPGNDLVSHTVARAVPSALRGLTSVFGMGTGVTLSVRSPRKLILGKKLLLPKELV